MLNWLEDNSAALNVLANFGMLAIWLVYLQLFLVSYRRQRKAKILVNRGVGSGIDAHCVISNMSAEAIYMQSILVTARAGREEWTAPVASADSEEEEGRSNPARRDGRQGPLAAGSFVDLGPFEKLMYQAVGQALGEATQLPELERIETIDVLVIGIYGSEDMLIGARRRFDVVGTGVTRRLRPQSVSTAQLGGRRNRAELERLMRATYLQ